MKELKDIYNRYLANNANVAEIQFLLQCFSDPSKQFAIEDMVSFHLMNSEGRRDQLSDAEMERAILEIHQSLHQKIGEGEEERIVQMKPARWWWVRTVAAIFIIGVISVGLVLYRSKITGLFAPAKMQYLYTKAGEKKIIDLPDGTRIWLSPGSMLAYPETFDGDIREVRLKGEAFFEVAKDKVHPFIIHSGKLVTRVVGTAFDVQEFEGQFTAMVTVVSGIVKVYTAEKSGKDSVQLKPNQQAVFDQRHHVLTSRNYPDAKQMLYRKDGILTYQGTTVANVAAEFSKYYNIELVAGPRVKDCLCYGQFDTNKPVTIVLEQLAAAVNGTCVIENNKYVIKGGCNP